MKSPGAYAKARILALVAALEKYHQFQETDSLHRIRVEIKKYKTLLLVLGFADRKFDAHEHYLPLRNIFRKAGQIRQPSVMLELMMANRLEGLPVERLGNVGKARDRFRADTPFFMTEIAKLGKRMKPRWKKLRRKDITGYIKATRKQVKNALVPRLKPAQLHTTRKRVKQLIYLGRLSRRLDAKELRFYKDLDAAIGTLHDKESLLEFLLSLPRRAVTTPIRLLRRQIAEDRKAVAALAGRQYAG